MTNTMRRLALPAFALCLALAGTGRAQADDVVYYHTDALGTPVAMTDSSGNVIAGSRREFEPFGRQLSPTTLADGPGFTGHVSDAATGLSYMQQRYYDPLIGQHFLSVDPVTAYSIGGGFNRYWYAAGNPYGLVDPDGRAAGPVIPPPPGPFTCPECNQPPPPPPPPTQPPFNAADAADAAAQGISLAGNALGVVELGASSEAKAWSAIASKGNGAIANAAAANASELGGLAKSLSSAGVGISVFTGGLEIAHAKDSGGVGHGVFTIGLGAAVAFDAVSGPVGLGIGLTDAAVQQVNYTSPITGESSSGWRAIMAIGNDSERLSTPNWVGH